MLHTGDSHELLPAFLAELAEAGRNVDFALVDGDHSAAGVRADVEALLDSPATSQTVIAIHDTANEDVRRGLDAVHYRAFPKVVYVDLDFVPGRVCRYPELRHEIWYGLGLVVVDASRPVYADPDQPPPFTGTWRGGCEPRFYPAPPLLAAVREAIVAREDGDGAADPGGDRALGGRLVGLGAAPRARAQRRAAEARRGHELAELADHGAAATGEGARGALAASLRGRP